MFCSSTCLIELVQKCMKTSLANVGRKFPFVRVYLQQEMRTKEIILRRQRRQSRSFRILHTHQAILTMLSRHRSNKLSLTLYIYKTEDDVIIFLPRSQMHACIRYGIGTFRSSVYVRNVCQHYYYYHL